MTAANFILHGMEGEVVCGNGLLPDDCRLALRINEGINIPFSQYFHIPHCEIVDFKDTMQGQCAKAHKTQLQEAVPTQLVLF